MVDALAEFCGDCERDDSQPIHEIALIALNNIMGMVSVTFDLKSAVHMFHLANNLCKFCDEHVDVYANIGNFQNADALHRQLLNFYSDFS